MILDTFGRSLRLTPTDPPDKALVRLAAVVLPAREAAPLKPTPVGEWLAGQAGKRFVGKVDDRKFKLGYLPAPSPSFSVNGSVVVIVGRVDGHALAVRLRPPRFVSAFLAAWGLAGTGAVWLSFHGPLNGTGLQLLLAVATAFPFVVVGGFFRREAALAERALREVLVRS